MRAIETFLSGWLTDDAGSNNVPKPISDFAKVVKRNASIFGIPLPDKKLAAKSYVSVLPRDKC